MNAPAPQPPRWADKFLAWFCKDNLLEIVQGDIYELFLERQEAYGSFRANLLYIRDVFDLFRPFAWKKWTHLFDNYSLAMFRNYMIVGWRNLIRHKAISSINILGLAVGFACCILLGLFLRHERAVDKHHEHVERIFRVITVFKDEGEEAHLSLNGNIISPWLQRNFTEEVQAGVRMYPTQQVLNYQDQMYKERRLWYADSSVFDIFSFEPIRGNLAKALIEPHSLVLTRSTAQKYFGKRNPMGEFIEVGSSKTPYQVTGVIEDLPSHSHFQFDMLAPFHSLSWAVKKEEIYPANYFTYVLLNNSASQAKINAEIPRLLKELGGEELATDMGLYLQPLKEVYLNSGHVEGEPELAAGDPNYLLLMGILAIVILLIASINYINLTTARSVDRAREVGMRKVIGAKKTQLVHQFIGETVLITLFSLGIALLLVELFLPPFNQLILRELTSAPLYTPIAIVFLIAGSILMGILAGTYPAMILSQFHPLKVLRGRFRRSPSGNILRKGLVVFQFALSILLIIGAIVVEKQLRYISDKKLGYDKENLVELPLDSRMVKQLAVIKAEMERHPAILKVGACTEGPHWIEGGYTLSKQSNESEGKNVTAMAADEDVMEALSLELVTGNNFSQADIQGENYAFLLNEQAAKMMGWNSLTAIGQRVALHGREGEVRGVVKDFHFASIHQKIGPLVLFTPGSPYDIRTLMVRISPGNPTDAMEHLESVWQEVASHRPFEYQFADQQYDSLYRDEQRMGKVSMLSAVLAIFLAALGLFGLALYTTTQKRKEISIRKVLGATPTQLVSLLSRDFTLLVGIAFVIATPIAWKLMSGWLTNFSYRTQVGWEPILLAGIGALLIAWLTISTQSFRAAIANPADALREE